MNSVLLITLLVMGAVIAIMAAVYRWLGWTRDVEARLAKTFTPTQSEIAGSSSKLADHMNRQLRHTSFAEKLDRQLAAADSNLTVAEFLMIRVGVALVLFLLGWLIAANPISGVVLAIIGWLLPNMHLKRKQSQRSKAFGSQLPDMLSMLSGSLRSGYGLLHAISMVQDEMPNPMAIEFSRVIKENALGYSLTDALDHMAERVQNEDFTLIVTAIHVQNEVGGSLAEVLDTISHTIRERVQLAGQIQAMTSQQRITGTLLTGMPIGMGVVLMLLNPEYMMEIFQPGWPLLIPAGAAVMIVIGNIAMSQAVKIEV
jgi:tight adherence protein B